MENNEEIDETSTVDEFEIERPSLFSLFFAYLRTTILTPFLVGASGSLGVGVGLYFFHYYSFHLLFIYFIVIRNRLYIIRNKTLCHSSKTRPYLIHLQFLIYQRLFLL